MNPKGHPASLVAAQAGNANAVTHGAFAHSGLSECTATWMNQLTAVFGDDPRLLLPMEEVARLAARIARLDVAAETISMKSDRQDYLEGKRATFSKQLRSWYDALREEAGHLSVSDPPVLHGELAETVAALQSIMRDPKNPPSARIAAANALLERGPLGTTSGVVAEEERRRSLPLTGTRVGRSFKRQGSDLVEISQSGGTDDPGEQHPKDPITRRRIARGRARGLSIRLLAELTTLPPHECRALDAEELPKLQELIGMSADEPLRRLLSEQLSDIEDLQLDYELAETPGVRLRALEARQLAQHRFWSSLTDLGLLPDDGSAEALAKTLIRSVAHASEALALLERYETSLPPDTPEGPWAEIRSELVAIDEEFAAMHREHEKTRAARGQPSHWSGTPTPRHTIRSRD